MGPEQFGAGQQYPPGQYGADYPPGSGPGPRGDARPGRDQRPPGPGASGPNTGSWSRSDGPVIRQRDAALPEPAPTAKSGALAIEADSVATFARDLRVLRSNAGLDYPEMAEKSHYTMRTLASAAGGLRLPTLPVLIAYVQACDGDVTEWEERWGKLVKSKRGQAALPAAGADATADVPAGPGPRQGGPRPGGPRPGGPGPGDARAPGQPPGERRPGEVYVITSARPRDDHW